MFFILTKLVIGKMRGSFCPVVHPYVLKHQLSSVYLVLLKYTSEKTYLFLSIVFKIHVPLVGVLNTCIVSMLYFGKEQIQFSKTADPRRALMFCTTDRKMGRREMVVSSDEEEEVGWSSWSQVSLQLWQQPRATAPSL